MTKQEGSQKWINTTGPIVRPTKDGSLRKKNPRWSVPINDMYKDVLISMLSTHMGSSVVMLLSSKLTSLGITLEDTTSPLSTLMKHIFYAHIWHLGDEGGPTHSGWQLAPTHITKSLDRASYWRGWKARLRLTWFSPQRMVNSPILQVIKSLGDPQSLEPTQHLEYFKCHHLHLILGST